MVNAGRTVGFIFARGGSKGVPGKNIKQLCGKPLISYSIELAITAPKINAVYVSTDSDEIAAVARRYGAEVIPRPSELATDSAPEWAAWQHAVRWVLENEGAFDCFISLPATSPLRSGDDISNCLDAFGNDCEVVLSMTNAARSPWFNMVKVNDTGALSILVNDGTSLLRRQDAPPAFDLTTVAYVTSPSFILNHEGIWEGRVHGVEIPQERAVDIDTPTDFLFAEFLMRERFKDE